jgi:hypothetical protein
MTRRKKMLLTATAAAALLGMTAPGALAFDRVNWEWDKHVREWVTIKFEIENKHLKPDGFVEVEKLQAHFGDVTAYATMKDIDNITSDKKREYDTKTTTNHPPPPRDDHKISAKDLPKVENAAIAIANNQSIESDVPLFLHDGQFAAGDLGSRFCTKYPEECADLLGGIDANNFHTEVAGVLTLAAIAGIIGKAEIKAEAKVESITNAFVDNSATAIANNASYTLESDDGRYDDNHIMIADLTQWSYADVTAKAETKDVDIKGYDDFSEACFTNTCDGEDGTTPIVQNVATAIGNNLNIKVGVPDTNDD